MQLNKHNFWSREKYISRGIQDSFVLGEIQEAAILECDITAYESVRQREGGTNLKSCKSSHNDTTCSQYIRQDDECHYTFSFLLFQSSAVSLVNLVTVSEGFTAEDEQTFQDEHEVKFIVSFVFHAGGGWGEGGLARKFKVDNRRKF